jgi:hypothetical protein
MSTLPKSRLYIRRRRQRTIILSAIFIFVLLILVGIVSLLRAPFLRIKDVRVEGAESVSTSTIADLLKRKISGSYALLFPKDDLLFYPKKELASVLLTQYPQIRTATVRADLTGTLNVSVFERAPEALWCGEGESSNCFLMDSSGVVYKRSDSLSSVSVEYKGDLQDNGSKLPVQFLTPTTFESLEALSKVLGAQAVKAGSGNLEFVSVESDSTVRVHFSSGFEILFTMTDDAGKVADHFLLALTAAPLQNVPLSNFQYLDLRFGNKIYYKTR